MSQHFNNRSNMTGSFAAANESASASASFAALLLNDTVLAVSFFVAVLLALVLVNGVALGLIVRSIIIVALIILAVLLITAPRMTRSKPSTVRI